MWERHCFSLFGCSTVRAHSGPVFKGVCKNFSRSQGHGFIRPSHGGEDIFAHISEWVNNTENHRDSTAVTSENHSRQTCRTLAELQIATQTYCRSAASTHWTARTQQTTLFTYFCTTLYFFQRESYFSQLSQDTATPAINGQAQRVQRLLCAGFILPFYSGQVVCQMWPETQQKQIREISTNILRRIIRLSSSQTSASWIWKSNIYLVSNFLIIRAPADVCICFYNLYVCCSVITATLAIFLFVMTLPVFTLHL